MCGSTPAGYVAQLAFEPGGQSYSLTIEVLDYHGAGTYRVPPERISIRGPVTSSGASIYPATAGTVAIDSGQRTGAIDVSLASPGGPTQLTGRWAC
jgi:hypothetical protein